MKFIFIQNLDRITSGISNPSLLLKIILKIFKRLAILHCSGGVLYFSKTISLFFASIASVLPLLSKFRMAIKLLNLL